jgi:iron complex transport system substrate-binding protein
LPRSTRTSTARSSALVALLLPLLLAVVGCGDSSASTGKNAGGSAASGDWPVTVSGDNGELTLEEQPDTIVSLSASATEMLFAIGAGDQVEAVDNTSNYPADAPVTDLSAFTPNAEAIAAYSPDLVVLSDDMNGVIDALGALKVPVLQLGAAATLDDSYEQLATLGDATGHADKASEVTADMRERIAAAVASVPASARGERVYHELDPTFYSVAGTTFIGGLYSMFGLENIADGAADASGGYPQLSAEYVVGQAPDLIVLADTVCCAQSAETLAQRPAFDTVPAVKEGRVLEANDDIASRWGPRVADFAESVAETLRG